MNCYNSFFYRQPTRLCKPYSFIAYSFLLFSFLTFPTDVFSQEDNKIKQYRQQLLSDADDVRYDALTKLIINFNEKNMDDTTALYLMDLKDLVEKTNNDEYRAAMHQLYGSWYARNRNFDSANYHFEKSIDYSNKINNAVSLANAYTTKGRMLSQYLSSEDSALYYYQKAEVLYLEKNDSSLAAHLYNNMGTLYSNHYGNFPKALKYYRLALRHIGEDIYTRSTLLGNIGNILLRAGQPKEAEKELLNAIELQKKTQSWRKIAGNYKDLARIYQILGDTSKVIESSELSFSYRERIGTPVQNFEAKNSLALAYVAYGYWDKAVLLLEENLKSFDLISFSEARKIYFGRYTNLLLALCYHEANTPFLAKQHVKAADQFDIFNKKLTSARYNNLITLSYEIFEEMGLYEKATFFYKKKLLLTDSLFSEQNRRMILELETKYETEKKEQEIVNLQQASEIQSLALTRKNYQIMTAVLIILVLVLAGYSYNRRLKLQKEKVKLQKEKVKLVEEKKRILEEEIDKKSRMLATTSVQWINMTEQLNKLKLYLKNEFVDADEDKSKKLIRRIERIKDFENRWESFKTHFEIVHPYFFKELQNSFPQLTPKDLKTCAFIKMKHNNSEIAQILDVSKKAVEQSKRRMKKKLNLNFEDDLQIFIDGFDNQPTLKKDSIEEVLSS